MKWVLKKSQDRMKKYIFLLFLSFLFTTCKNQEFQSEKWLPLDAIYDGERIKMVNDLLENHLYFGMKYSAIKKLLGESTNKDSLTLKYVLEEKFGKIDPNGKIFLKLDFDNNRELIQWNIIETGYKE